MTYEKQTRFVFWYRIGWNRSIVTPRMKIDNRDTSFGKWFERHRTEFLAECPDSHFPPWGRAVFNISEHWVCGACYENAKLEYERISRKESRLIEQYQIYNGENQ